MTTFFDLMRNMVMILNTFVRVDDQNLTEEQKTTVLDNIGATSKEEFADVIEQVANLRADIEYVKIDITKISDNVGTVEMGTSVPEMKVTWELNKTPTSQTLGGESVDVDVRSMTVNMEGRTSVTLTVTDERGVTDSATAGYSSYNGIYYGASYHPGTVESWFIRSLTKELSGNRSREFAANAGEGEHIWYALPARLGACSFSVGGFSGGFELVDTIDFTNASGYTESYNVYASAKTGLGETRVVVV